MARVRKFGKVKTGCGACAMGFPPRWSVASDEREYGNGGRTAEVYPSSTLSPHNGVDAG